MIAELIMTLTGVRLRGQTATESHRNPIGELDHSVYAESRSLSRTRQIFP